VAPQEELAEGFKGLGDPIILIDGGLPVAFDAWDEQDDEDSSFLIGHAR